MSDLSGFFTSDCWWRLKSERPVCEVSLRFQELETSNLIRKKDQKGMSVEGLKIYGATKHSQVEKHGSCHVRTRHIRHTFPPNVSPSDAKSACADCRCQHGCTRCTAHRQTHALRRCGCPISHGEDFQGCLSGEVKQPRFPQKKGARAADLI